MDSISFLLFFIFVMTSLLIIIYISPILSAFIMLIVPIASVYLLPDVTVEFLSMEQFTFGGVPIYNIHILLIIWSGLLGIIIYSELLSWYLLMDQASPSETKAKSSSDILKADEPPKSTKNKIEDFLLRLGKMMSGGK